MILGVPIGIAFMWGAGFLYAASTLLFLRVFRKEQKNELTIALFAFLVSMAFALFLMGGGEYWKNMVFGYLGVLSVLVGSVFMLKFPLTVFPESARKILFRSILVGVLMLFAWLVISPSGSMVMSPFIMWYMVGVNGLVSGFFIFFVGLRAKEKWLKVKATGGGLGIISCCIASHVAGMAGALLISAIFQFIAPLLLILSVFLGHHYQQQSQKK